MLKAKFLHPLIIFLQSGSMFIFFLYTLIKSIVALNSGKFGASFYVGGVSLILFAILAIYYRKMKKMIIEFRI